MRSKIINISSLLLLLSVVGCSEETTTTTNSGLELSKKEILFTVDAESILATKGSVVASFSELENVGIYAFSEGDMHIENDCVAWNGANWSFDPSLYWSETAPTLDFFAYAPYGDAATLLAAGYTISKYEEILVGDYVDEFGDESGDEVVDESGEGVDVESADVEDLVEDEGEGLVFVNYEMPVDAADQVDLLVAVQTATSEDGDVNLFFKHPMAAICLKIDDSQQANIIDKPFVLKDIVDMGLLKVTTTGFSWDGLGISGREDGYSIGYISAPSTIGESLVSESNYVMVVPQVIPGEMSLSVTLTDGSVLTTQIEGSWVAGKVYTYVVSITEDKLTGSTGTYSDYSILVSDVTIADAWSVQQPETAEDYDPSGGANFNVDLENNSGWGSDANATDAVSVAN